MKRLVLILTVLFISNTTFSQKIDVNNIEILRDSFGVPHIYAKTDAELAYGLAWAHSEDAGKQTGSPSSYHVCLQWSSLPSKLAAV